MLCKSNFESLLFIDDLLSQIKYGNILLFTDYVKLLTKIKPNLKLQEDLNSSINGCIVNHMVNMMTFVIAQTI